MEKYTQLKKQLEKNLNDYSEEDFQDDEAECIVTNALVTIIEYQKNELTPQTIQKVKERSAKFQKSEAMVKAYFYLLDRNGAKYSGGGGMFRVLVDEVKKLGG